MSFSAFQIFNPLKSYGAVSIIALMTASCAGSGRDDLYRGDSVRYQPPSSYQSAYSKNYSDEPSRYNSGSGIDAARSAHRFNSAYRAEQLDGGCESSITLDDGETLSDIAEFCDVSIASILMNNPHIRNANRVSVGETIFIPNARANIYADNQLFDQYDNIQYLNNGRWEGPRDGDSGYYVVKHGDTLAEIAQRFDVSLNDIARLNPNLDPGQLAIGERLYLPENTRYGANTDAPRRQARSSKNQSPFISITPAHGPRNGEIRLVGDNFPRGEQVYILYGDSPDTLIRIRTIASDHEGRIDERITLPESFGHDVAYFAIQRGSDTYMSQSYYVDSASSQNQAYSSGGLFNNSDAGNQSYRGPYQLMDQAALIAVDQDVYWGDKVTLVAHSFPPNTPVSIYVGPNRNALIKIAETRTGAEGVFQMQVAIPDTINSDTVYFVAAIENGARTYFSERVRIRADGYRRDGERHSHDDRTSSTSQFEKPYRSSTKAAPASSELDRGRNDRQGNVNFLSRVRQNTRGDDVNINNGGVSSVSGILTNEGISCPTLRDDSGRLYTLLGDLQGFDDGDRVLISGSAAADRRICGQSETIQVFSIAKAPW